MQIFQERNNLAGMYIRPYRFRVRTESGTPVEQRVSERYKAEDTPSESSRNGIELARRAYRHYQAGEYEQAVDLYHQAAGLIPKVAAVWNDLGASEFGLGHLDASVKAFNKAVALKPDYALAWRNIGLLAGKQSDYAKSVQYSEKAARLDPSAENLRYAGHACLLAGAAQKDPVAKKRLLTRSLAFFEKSLALEKNSGVQKRVEQLKKYLAAKRKGS